jgi:hypothetical protein
VTELPREVSGKALISRADLDDLGDTPIRMVVRDLVASLTKEHERVLGEVARAGLADRVEVTVGPMELSRHENEDGSLTMSARETFRYRIKPVE